MTLLISLSLFFVWSPVVELVLQAVQGLHGDLGVLGRGAVEHDVVPHVLGQLWREDACNVTTRI